MDPSRPDVRELYERYGRAVFRRCQFFLKSDADAEDAMHEVFIKVVLRYHEFRGEASPLTWLVRITTHHCLNILRGQKAAWRERYTTTVKVDAEGRPAPEATRLERAQLLTAVLAKVDKKTQEAAVYYFVDEMNQEDAARAAACSVPTLRKRLREFVRVGRKALRAIDADVVFGEEPI